MVEYEIQGRIAVILGCSGEDKDVEIPNTIEDCPVGKIAENAFAESKSLRRIVIPKSVKVIEKYAFASCGNLSEVVFNEGLEIIDDWAFISCNLERISLPNSIKKIGENAFLGCGVKKAIDEFMKKKNSGNPMFQQIKPDNICVFPVSIIQNPGRISSEHIKAAARYFNKQLFDLDNNMLSYESVDIPYCFDEDEFAIALIVKKELSDFKIELNLDTEKFIGLYNDDDPDFVNIGINVIAKDEKIGEVTLKTPYLEAARFEVLETSTLGEGEDRRYYLKVKAFLDCYGTGNLDREFAMNQFDHLIGKYYTQFQYGIIPDDIYSQIKESVDAEAFDTLRTFLSQVQRAPLLTYTYNLLQAVLADPEFQTNNSLLDFEDGKLTQIYVTLTDYASFESVCYDLDDVLNAIAEFTNLSLKQLSERYQIFNVDFEGNEITDLYLKEFRKAFVDVDANFSLHADYLAYIYQSMKNLYEQFTDLAFPYFFKED